jgi:hypothetical protein
MSWGEELVGSYLYEVHLHHRLESHGYGLSFSQTTISMRIGSPSPSMDFYRFRVGSSQSFDKIFAEDNRVDDDLASHSGYFCKSHLHRSHVHRRTKEYSAGRANVPKSSSTELDPYLSCLPPIRLDSASQVLPTPRSFTSTTPL